MPLDEELSTALSDLAAAQQDEDPEVKRLISDHLEELLVYTDGRVGDDTQRLA